MHFTLTWFEKEKEIEEQKKRIKNLPLASETPPKNKPLGVCDMKNKIKKKNRFPTTEKHDNIITIKARTPGVASAIL